jgi:hypothetical protein
MARRHKFPRVVGRPGAEPDCCPTAGEIFEQSSLALTRQDPRAEGIEGTDTHAG